MQVFACGRPKPPRCQPPCNASARRCEFPLTGGKAGEICTREVCDSYAKTVKGKRVCLPHAKMMEAKT
jgi:hypothetical protein